MPDLGSIGQLGLTLRSGLRSALRLAIYNPLRSLTLQLVLLAVNAYFLGASACPGQRLHGWGLPSERDARLGPPILQSSPDVLPHLAPRQAARTQMSGGCGRRASPWPSGC